ncbi:MAG: sigma-E processing peptidase SpoIIGA [Clostridia bacterium]|nr:sigma-E processing peptidase SpoIIGA [Clostridia bacterium]
MIVYVEYVLIDNFIIDYLLLSCSIKITSLPSSKVRLILCSLLGAVFALTYPLFAVSNILLFLIKMAFALFLVAVVGKNYTFKQYYATLLIFLCFTFLTGGAIFALENLTGVDFSTEIPIALAFLPVFGVCKGVSAVLDFIYKRKIVFNNLVEVTVSINGVTKRASGFVDTGNMLYDGNSPVILCSKYFAKDFLFGKKAMPKIKYISVSTVTGICQKPSFKVDEITVCVGDKKNIFNNVTMCVSESGAFDRYQVIIHPKLVEVQDETYLKANA